ncbi:hypothetical protein [Boseongicola aestuarii]|uniref:Uncharacterized protein n=1 Tax=Boseongicola aestuarii TaxID=1470561 RepID=A0A238J3U9_9RHOB|nr:hypothetical protein [Boseongicola aestuarii]SMX25409.1 hypothetical protein BOA8489_03552 [Boseongicola aestuarii]
MAKAVLWSDLIASVPVETTQSLKQFLYFSELRTGAPDLAEQRLLETLSITVTRRRYVS